MLYEVITARGAVEAGAEGAQLALQTARGERADQARIHAARQERAERDIVV